MTDLEHAILPPAKSEAGLFATPLRITQKDLAGNGEHLIISEAREQRGEKVRRHTHVTVEQHDDIVLRSPKPGIRTAAESRDSPAAQEL